MDLIDYLDQFYVGRFLRRLIAPFKFKTLKNYANKRFWLKTFLDEKNVFHWKNDLKSLKETHEKYKTFLEIGENDFKDKIVIDIGCGPQGSLHFFNAKLKFGVDPVIKDCSNFIPLNKHDMVYLNCSAENLPLINEFADVVIAINSLDHVHSFEKTIKEIHRVLKQEGRIIFNLNLTDKATIAEPELLSIKRVNRALENLFLFNIVKSFSPEGSVNYERILLKGKKI